MPSQGAKTPRKTKQELYDEQAEKLLAPKLPPGWRRVGPGEIELPVDPSVPPDKRAAISLRVSKGREDMISPDLQWDPCKTMCVSKGLVPARLFIDMHKSGRTFEKRHVTRMAEDVAAHRYGHVVLWKWSRWGRNAAWSQLYLAEVEQAGGKVHAATEDLDASTAVGKFTRTTLLAIAEFESDQKAEGWKATHERRRLHGENHGGGPRFGYIYEKQKYRIDPVVGPQLRLAYMDYIADARAFNKIARLFNRLGLDNPAFLTPYGNLWSTTTVKQMMDNGFAAGLIRERPDVDRKDPKHRTLPWSYEREGVHPKIITREQWDTYLVARERNRLHPFSPAGVRYELSGLCVHTSCWAALTHNGKPDGGKPPRYRCASGLNGGNPCEGTSIRDDEAVPVVLEALREQVEGSLSGRIERRLQAADHQEKIERLETQLAEVVDRRQRIQESREDGLYTREEARKKMEARNAQEAAIRGQLAELRQGGDWEPGALQGILDVWDELDPARRNLLLRRVIRRIEVKSRPVVRGKRRQRPASELMKIVWMWEE